LTVFAKKIQEKIRSTDFTVAEGIQLKKTCSIGYATFPFYEDQPELLNFEHTAMIADLGLFHAKKHGRNQTIFLAPAARTPGSSEEIKRMVTSIDFALKNRYLNLQKQ
jgi:predicted signal transduction protein with EAL and GGDEF domain